MNITIFTLASKLHGLGHIKRMLVLARELQRRGHGVTFATEHETIGVGILRSSGFETLDYSPSDYTWSDRPADLCLIDLEHGPARAMLEAVRLGRCGKVVVIAGSGYTLVDRVAVDELADLIICQSIIETQAEHADVLSGVEYMLVDPAFAQLKPSFDGPIVVAFGGTDPHNLTPKAVKALGEAGRKVEVMTGQADSLIDALDGASLLVGALGMTAYEAAAAGIPALLSGWSPDHVKTAEQLEAHGCAASLGLWSNFDGESIRTKLDAILSNRKAWTQMSKAGKALVDGGGPARAIAVLEAMARSDNIIAIGDPYSDTGLSRGYHAN